MLIPWYYTIFSLSLILNIGFEPVTSKLEADASIHMSKRDAAAAKKKLVFKDPIEGLSVKPYSTPLMAVLLNAAFELAFFLSCVSD